MTEDRQFNNVIFLIAEAFGLSSSWQGNALLSANLEHLTDLWSSSTSIALDGIVQDDAQLDTENYYSIIGAGSDPTPSRKVIELAKLNGSFAQNKILHEIISKISKYSSLHLLGILNRESLTTDLSSLETLVSMSITRGCTQIYVHLVIDGSWETPDEAVEALRATEAVLQKQKYGEIVSVSGQNALKPSFSKNTFFDCIFAGMGRRIFSVEQAFNHRCPKILADLQPHVINSANNVSARIKDFDSLIIFSTDFEYADKVLSFFNAKRSPYDTVNSLRNITAGVLAAPLIMEHPGVNVAFRTQINQTFSELLTQKGIPQLYFGDETRSFLYKKCFSRDEPVMSRMHVERVEGGVEYYTKHYREITEKITAAFLAELKTVDHHFITVTLPFLSVVLEQSRGDFNRAVEAAAFFDRMLEYYMKAAEATGSLLILFSPTGGIERVGQPITKNSIVPFIITGKGFDNPHPLGGSLQEQLLYSLMHVHHDIYDVAPTILDLYSIPQPLTMSGKSLLQ